MTEQREWCMICGEVRGNCCHKGEFTTRISVAYKIWMDHKRRKLRELEDVSNECKGEPT